MPLQPSEVATLEEDLIAARISLRRMIHDQNTDTI